MKDKKQSAFGKFLYALIIGSHCEDYLAEDKDGNPVRTPAEILQSTQQRQN